MITDDMETEKRSEGAKKNTRERVRESERWKELDVLSPSLSSKWFPALTLRLCC